jgi:diadenosine tetraphosphate (Ap4A) HIT family hydrolase
MKGCGLCAPKDVLFESDFAYVCYEARPLSKGHVIVVPKRHVADFFDMSGAEQGSILALLNRAKKHVQEKHRPDGYNIGVNIGAVAGQSRMHVHVHLIPRYAGDPHAGKGVRAIFS